MKTLHKSYQTVADHIAAEMVALSKSEKPADIVILKRLQKRREWLLQRKDSLEERNRQALAEMNKLVDAYLSLCDDFWKEMHNRTYENMMDRLLDAKKQVVNISALSGFDAYYALFVILKTLRNILPSEQYQEHAPALSALEAVKSACMSQIKIYISHANINTSEI